jgi:hypothetical protein
MHLGEDGTEQFTIITRVNDKMIDSRPIHDPFHCTRVKLRGFRHAWNALTRGIDVQVSVNGSHGAQAAIMCLDPQRLREETNIFLERQAQRREENTAAGLIGYYSEASQ